MKLQKLSTFYPCKESLALVTYRKEKVEYLEANNHDQHLTSHQQRLHGPDWNFTNT